MVDESEQVSGSRAIQIPSLARGESEYEALRNAKRSGHADKHGRWILVSESGIVRTARAFAETGIDPRPFLHRLRQPCPSLGVNASEVDEVRNDRRAPRDEPFRIEAESASDMADHCQAAIQALNCDQVDASSPECTDWEGLEMADVTKGSDVGDVCAFLHLLFQLCDHAREYGIPLEIEKTA